MAYIAYPMPKAHPPYGDTFHEQVPAIVTTVVEYEEIMGQSRPDFGCASCNNTDPIVITLGRTRCGVWLEADVLLDTLACSAEERMEKFALREAWWWDWGQDFTGEEEPDTAALPTRCAHRGVWHRLPAGIS